MRTNIALIGFMGTGKTAVGQALARKLNKRFLEMDSLIEQRAGKAIPDIFQQDGEITFRELEIETCKQVSRHNNAVIACGGGVVLNRINIDRLKKTGVIVYLTASPDVILRRTSGDGPIRPLLEVEDPAATIRDMLQFRQPFYQRAADIKIDTSQLDIDSVVDEITGRLPANESPSQ